MGLALGEEMGRTSQWVSSTKYRNRFQAAELTSCCRGKLNNMGNLLKASIICVAFPIDTAENKCFDELPRKRVSESRYDSRAI